MPQLFSPSSNKLPLWIALAAGFVIAVAAAVTAYHLWGPKPYAPEQPLAFSHATHMQKAGMTCIACHPSAFHAAKAGVPDSQSCLACHKHILPDSPKLARLHASANPDSPDYTGEPIRWNKVNKLAAHVKFDHSVHVNRGVGCSTCHEGLDRQDRTTAIPDMSMSWCLNCHRSPYGIRPLEEIANPEYQDDPELSDRLIEQWKIDPGTNCNTCHH